jgi:hypothetical protein
LKWNQSLGYSRTQPGLEGESLTTNAEYWPRKIGSVRLVGSGKLKFTRDEAGLHVSLPKKFDGKTAFALEIKS